MPNARSSARRASRRDPTIHTVGVRLTADELAALDAEVERQAERAPGANVSRSSFLRGFVAKLTRKSAAVPALAA